MVWENDFRCSHIQLDSNDTTSVIGAVSQHSISGNPEIQKETTSGSIYPDTVILNALRPVARFTTFDIPGAITAFGSIGTVFGSCIIKDVDDTGLTLYLQKQSCAGVAAGSVHVSYTIPNGVVVPRTLNVDHRGNAQLTYEVFSRYDGTNAPLIRAASEALPSLASEPVGRWGMYSATVAGQALEGKRNISIDFGVSVTQEGADSEQYDTVVSVGSVMPRITIRGVDESWASTVAGITGTSGTHANTEIELQKRGVSTASTVHVRLTAAGLVSWDTFFDGTPDRPGETTLAIDCVYDGTNAPIVAYTGVDLLP